MRELRPEVAGKSVRDKTVQDKSVQDKSNQDKSNQDKSGRDKSVRDKLARGKAASIPVSSSDEETPPIVKRADLVAFSLLALLVICVIAVLYVARVFFLPIVTAFVMGTMLSRTARYLERKGFPRSLAAIFIVIVTFLSLAMVLGLISAPLIDWTTRLPELALLIKEKLTIFERPLALWHQLQGMLGSTASSDTSFELPRIDWMKPTLEFLSPTFTEISLFFATLILFIASWPDLRRALILNFADHDSRLRTLRILNAIETNLGGYLITVTLINMAVGTVTGVICALAGMPNPAGLGALAAVLNYVPIIGPVVTFVVLVAVGIITSSTLTSGLIAAVGFIGVAFIEGHFVTPAIIGRRLALNALAVFIALAFWTWLWGPMGAFLSSPILIVGLVLKEHLMPVATTQLPQE